MRGSNSAFNALPKKDPDTLYFISEPDSATGVLYLGNQMIADTIDASTGTLNLSDLANVKIGQGLQDKDILVFQDGKWRNQPLSDILILDSFNSETPGLVPIATEEEREKFLRGDGTWQEVITPATIGTFIAETPIAVANVGTFNNLSEAFQNIHATILEQNEILEANIGIFNDRLNVIESQLEWHQQL